MPWLYLSQQEGETAARLYHWSWQGLSDCSNFLVTLHNNDKAQFNYGSLITAKQLTTSGAYNIDNVKNTINVTKLNILCRPTCNLPVTQLPL